MKIPQAQFLVLSLAVMGIAAPITKDAVTKGASTEATNHLAPLAFGAPYPNMERRSVTNGANVKATDHLAPLVFGVHSNAVETRAVSEDANTEAADHLAPLAFGSPA